jgi:hypothetical protein
MAMRNTVENSLGCSCEKNKPIKTSKLPAGILLDFYVSGCLRFLTAKNKSLSSPNKILINTFGDHHE